MVRCDTRAVRRTTAGNGRSSESSGTPARRHPRRSKSSTARVRFPATIFALTTSPSAKADRREPSAGGAGREAGAAGCAGVGQQDYGRHLNTSPTRKQGKKREVQEFSDITGKKLDHASPPTGLSGQRRTLRGTIFDTGMIPSANQRRVPCLSTTREPL